MHLIEEIAPQMHFQNNLLLQETLRQYDKTKIVIVRYFRLVLHAKCVSSSGVEWCMYNIFNDASVWHAAKYDLPYYTSVAQFINY